MNIEEILTKIEKQMQTNRTRGRLDVARISNNTCLWFSLIVYAPFTTTYDSR